jgi:pyrroloquinoline quinone biosynthesis protein D
MVEADVHDDSRPTIGRGFRLQWESAQNAYVLLYPEGMVRLNASAGEILKRCSGEATIDRITADLEAAFATTGLKADVMAFLVMALDKRWVAVS